MPQVISRHAHPKAPPDEDAEPVTYTGIDYLQLVAGAGQAGAGEQLRLSNIAGEDRTGHGDGTQDDPTGHDEQDEGR